MKLQKTIRKIFILLMIFAAGIISCKKDSDSINAGSLNIEGRWKIIAITTDPAYDGITDLLADLNESNGNNCISETVTIFNKNGTIDANIAMGCSKEHLVVIGSNPKWYIEANKLNIESDYSIVEFDYSIIGDEMKWTDITTLQGVTYKQTWVFKRVL